MKPEGLKQPTGCTLIMSIARKKHLLIRFIARNVASMAPDGDCHADIENFKHLGDADFKRVVCTGSEKPRDPINGGEGQCCPYYQKTYGCCFEDGELYWLDDVAKLLEVYDGEQRK